MEKQISTKRIYEGRVLNLRVDQVETENGMTAGREVVEHNGAAAIVPVLPTREVIMVRQYRYPTGSDLLEIPAGTMTRNEDPEKCAKRELEEETGYRCGEITKICECFVAPGYSTEKIHVFLAKHLTKTQTNMDEDENIKLEPVPYSKALEMIRRGDIRDAKSIVGLYAAAQLL